MYIHTTRGKRDVKIKSNNTRRREKDSFTHLLFLSFTSYISCLFFDCLSTFQPCLALTLPLLVLLYHAFSSPSPVLGFVFVVRKANMNTYYISFSKRERGHISWFIFSSENKIRANDNRTENKWTDQENTFEFFQLPFNSFSFHFISSRILKKLIKTCLLLLFLFIP